jgi:acyl-CoA thioesterase-1
MSWVLYLFGGGGAFFLGVGSVLASVGVFALPRGRWARTAASLLIVVGLLLVALSSTPLPYWLYAVVGGVTLPWLVAERSSRDRWQARRWWLRAAVVVAWVAAAAVEFPYHLSPAPGFAGRPAVYVIGDSLAAGVGGSGEETWPRLLGQGHPVEVVNLARVGATTASAVKQADGLPPGGGVVLLEIGGNDLLGSTTAADFGRDLDRLLGRVCQPGRVVLMFELPLPPLCNGYGLAQRRLASAYQVHLIPKRVLMGVLTRDGATVDGLHLTGAGHQRMAGAVWSVLRPAGAE